MNKSIYGLVLATILTIAVLSISTITVNGANLGTNLCHKYTVVQVGIINAEDNSTFVGNATLDGQTRNDSTQTDVNQTYAVLAFEFTKMQCILGHPFSGFVNGTEFSGTIKSLHSPNKVNVDLN